MHDENKSAYRITVSTACRHTGQACDFALDLTARLRTAMRLAGPALDSAFRLEGTAGLTTCRRPCTLAFRTSPDATYVFGDAGAAPDLEALVALAQRQRDCIPDAADRDHRAEAAGDIAHGHRPAAVVAAERLPGWLQ